MRRVLRAFVALGFFIAFLAAENKECFDDRGDQVCIVTKCNGVVVAEECSQGGGLLII